MSFEERTQTLTTITRQLQKSSQSEFALVQLYSGNLEALKDKNQSITLYTGLLTGDELQQATHTLAGSMQRKQNQAAYFSLDLLRRYLQLKN
jgi:hypothetical protein